MNHVFVDFENVHQVDLTLIGAKSVSFTLLVGAKQTKLDSDLVEKSVVKKVAAKKVAKKVATKVAAQGVVKKKASILTANGGYERVWDDFTKNSSNLPARRKSLQSRIGHLIGKAADGEEVANVIKRLVNAGMLVFTENDWPKYTF
jgi:hypothetical protein